MDNAWLNYTFSIVMLVIGIVLVLTSFQVSSNYDSTGCTKKNVRNANQWIAMIGAILVVLPIFYLYIRKIDPSIDNNIGSICSYAIFSGLLGITLVILGAIMSSSSAKNPCKPIRTQATTIWVLGLILFLLAAFYGAYKGYQNAPKLNITFS